MLEFTDEGLHLVLQVFLFENVHGIVLGLIVFNEAIIDDVGVHLM